MDPFIQLNNVLTPINQVISTAKLGDRISNIRYSQMGILVNMVNKYQHVNLQYTVFKDKIMVLF